MMMTTGDLVVIIIRLLTSAQGLLLTHVCRLFISLLIFFEVVLQYRYR